MSSHITTNVSPYQGFHPISTNVVRFSASSSSLAQCSLYLYFKLPPLLFVDPHELALRNSTYTFRHWGSRDLEKPVHALPEAERDSDILLNIRLPPNRKPPEAQPVSGNTLPAQSWNVTVELPMHLRYGVPAPASSTSSEKPYDHVRVDSPTAFLLCKTSATLLDNSTQLPASLPSHVTESLPKAPLNMFIHIPAHPEFLSGKANSSYTDTITVPLGSVSDLPLVELGTALIIIICFFWLVRVSWNTSMRLAVRRHLKQK